MHSSSTRGGQHHPRQHRAAIHADVLRAVHQHEDAEQLEHAVLARSVHPSPAAPHADIGGCTPSTGRSACAAAGCARTRESPAPVIESADRPLPAPRWPRTESRQPHARNCVLRHAGEDREDAIGRQQQSRGHADLRPAAIEAAPPGGACSTAISTAPPHSPPTPKPWAHAQHDRAGPAPTGRCGRTSAAARCRTWRRP